MADTEKNLVIFDTDPGIDDAMALLFLKAQPSLKLAAVTTVFGNAETEVTTRNALYLTQRFGIDVPVYAGATRPLTIERGPAPAFIHGEDGLGDVGATQSFAVRPAEGHAADRMVEIIKANPGRVTILAVAPLTNLALALDRDPGIASLVKDVVIMGGAFAWGGRRGNATPVAEANVHNDPHAADRVFTADWPVTAIGLDVTSHCVATHDDAAQLASGGEAGRFLWDISRGYEDLYRRRNQVDGCCLHDVAAAAYLVAPELFALRSGAVRVVTEGIAIGQSIQKLDGHIFGPSAWDGHSSKLVAGEADYAGIVEAYKTAIRSLG
ncbi:nucleoside hydrolase [Pleomorphomonas sp. JP5]|uniref:nucleoside hydrolase n=1 Tax=Pleomorphomonas sp. JP5 TaxID=2942998 RepID=UPI0020438C81|nr:nucleoside hydrolase [Pleomorphomonas sp. JP5]MCM5556363.1 nucleoside hydrolase [Pleomorphomonas sp. JP5]